MSLYHDILPLLESLRTHFGPVLIDETAPWGGTIDEWLDFFVEKIDDIDAVLTVESAQRLEESALRWIRQKYGAKKAAAHRDFLKMVRKDPAAHRRKMRTDRLYHQKHKWHDQIMKRTARANWRRVRSSRHEGLEERDAGQSFMDLPFELRVTSGGTSRTCVCASCGYSESRKESACSTRGCPECGNKHLENFVEAATDSGEELTDKARAKAAAAASTKTGMDVPEHYLKECSMDAFYRNVHYFYRVKGKEWEGSKAAKVQRAVAASYSVLKRACGVDSKESMTPSEIVKQGGGKLGPRGEGEG